MIGIYTYSLIFIALALKITITGILKIALFTGAGMFAIHCTGAFPLTGSYLDSMFPGRQMRIPFTANALYAAVGNSFSAVLFIFLPTAINQRKIVSTTPGCNSIHGDSSFHPTAIQSKFKSTN